MPRYILTIILGVISAILILVTAIKKDKKLLYRILMIVSCFVTIISAVVETKLPSPEFYMTNGDSNINNKVYFKVEFPFSVYYTLEAYDDPKKNGTKYKDPFEMDSSFSIRYVSSIMGIMWGEIKSEDVILKANGEVETIDTNEPGKSIAEIEAYLNRNNIFPGDTLNKEDFIVKGTTIAGDKVTMDEFEFSPSKVVEGENKITVDYKGITSIVNFWAHSPKVISIKAEYLGDDVFVGSEIPKEDIKVTATYEDGHAEEVDNFEINPTMCAEEGENSIEILYGENSDKIIVNAVAEEEKNTSEGPLFNSCYEKHDDSSIISQIGFDHWDSTKSDVQGNHYDESQLYISIGDLYNQIQDTGDSFIDSTIIYIVNPEYDLSKGVHIKGKFVVDSEYMGSDAYTSVSIKIDGEKVWATDENISGSTISPMPFEFDVNQGAESMTMDFHCNARGSGLGLGIIFDEISERK